MFLMWYETQFASILLKKFAPMFIQETSTKPLKVVRKGQKGNDVYRGRQKSVTFSGVLVKSEWDNNKMMENSE